MSLDVEELERRHRRAMAPTGLLERPWLILGGAPDPVLPPDLLASHARVDINNSGKAAAERGLGRAALTVRRTRERWDVHPGLDTEVLLWFTAKNLFALRFKLLLQRQARVDRLIRMPKTERDAVVQHVVGPGVRSVGDLGKPSNGIAALCYGLFLGVPEIVLAGFSLTRSGHSYDRLARPRKQIDEDRFVLGRLAADRRVATTEAELAEETGIRLWQRGERR